MTIWPAKDKGYKMDNVESSYLLHLETAIDELEQARIACDVIGAGGMADDLVMDIHSLDKQAQWAIQKAEPAT